MKHLTDKSSREMNDREIRAAFALLTRAAAEKGFPATGDLNRTLGQEPPPYTQTVSNATSSLDLKRD